MSELFDVAGKTALITGGSRGIGYMVAEGLLRAGAEVVISARKADQVAAAAEELGKLGPCTGIVGDVSGHAGTLALAEQVAVAKPRLDILVNNAGATWGAPLEEFPDSAWDKILDTNVRSIFQLTVALLPQLREGTNAAPPARVINIGSIDGINVPSTENYSYGASKAAVHMLTRHLAKRLASEQITVNAIAPGPFESKMTAFMLQTDEGREAVASMVPLGRIGSPEDAAGLVQFLSSRAGAYLTGTVIPLDGGITGCS